MAIIRLRTVATTAGLSLVALLALPFVLHAVGAGLAGLFDPTGRESRFFVPGDSISNGAIFGHMVLGGLLMVFMPLQLVPVLRRRFPTVHRWCGRAVCLGAVLTGAGGLAYIVFQGTIGGPWMDAGFALYGTLLVLSALQAVRHGRARRFAQHRRWALRLVLLAFGSWFYRLHYGIWYLLTGGLASTPRFDGAFDLVQNVAFYLPYLLLLELWLRRERRES